MSIAPEPVARAWVDLTSCLLVGQLLLGCWLLPARGGLLSPSARRVLRASAATSAVWSVGSVALVAASTAALVDVPVSTVLRVPSVTGLAWQLPQVRALVLMAGVGLGVAAAAPLVRRTLTARAMLPLVLAAIACLAVTGHASSSSSHFWAAQSVLVHVLAVCLWLGGLAALLAHRGLPGGLPALAVRRFSAVAAVCFAAVVLSGAIGAGVRLGLSVDAWRSGYGALLGVKVVVLGVLGAVGLRHRRVTVPRLERGEPRAFVRLATGEVLLMGAGVALAVALARTPTPTGALTRVAPPHSEDFPTVDRMIEQPGWRLLSESRPDALALSVVLAAALAYLGAVRTLRRRGADWPVRRTAGFLLGCALALWALGGSLAAYSAASLALNATQNVVLALASPLALAAGAPFTLMAALRPGTPPRHRRALRNPVNAMLVLVLLFGAQYGTSLLETSFHHPWIHSLLAWAALTCGTLVACGVRGPDARSPENLLSRQDKQVVLLTLALALAVVALHLLAGTTLLAREWWTDLALFWSDPARSQTRAGSVLLAAAAAVVLLAVRTTDHPRHDHLRRGEAGLHRAPPRPVLPEPVGARRSPVPALPGPPG